MRTGVLVLGVLACLLAASPARAYKPQYYYPKVSMTCIGASYPGCQDDETVPLPYSCLDVQMFKYFLSDGGWWLNNAPYKWYFGEVSMDTLALSERWVDGDLGWLPGGHDAAYMDHYQGDSTMTVFVGHGDCSGEPHWNMLHSTYDHNGWCNTYAGIYKWWAPTGDMILGEYYPNEYGSNGGNDVAIMDSCCGMDLNRLATAWVWWNGGASWGNALVLGFRLVSHNYATHLWDFGERVASAKSDSVAWLEASMEMDDESGPLALGHGNTTLNAILIRDQYRSLYDHFANIDRASAYAFAYY